jgi:hypothetical protein
LILYLFSLPPGSTENSSLKAIMNQEQLGVHHANEAMDGQAVRSSQRVENPLKVHLQFLSFVTYIGGNRIIFVSRLHFAVREIVGVWEERGADLTMLN